VPRLPSELARLFRLSEPCSSVTKYLFHYFVATPTNVTWRVNVAKPFELTVSAFFTKNRIAGAHGHFTKEDYRKWLQNVKKCELARTLSRLAQLNQSKIYLFWKNPNLEMLITPPLEPIIETDQILVPVQICHKCFIHK